MEDWDGLTKTVVFKAGETSVSVLLDRSNECVIPWEVLQDHGRALFAGVYGTAGGDVVLPTIWVNLGTILEGAAPGEEARQPSVAISGGSAEEKYLTFNYDEDICEVPVACADDETHPHTWLDVWMTLRSDESPRWYYTRMLISTVDGAVTCNVLNQMANVWYTQGPDSGVFECDADAGMVTIGYMPN